VRLSLRHHPTKLTRSAPTNTDTCTGTRQRFFLAGQARWGCCHGVPLDVRLASAFDRAYGLARKIARFHRLSSARGDPMIRHVARRLGGFVRSGACEKDTRGQSSGGKQQIGVPFFRPLAYGLRNQLVAQRALPGGRQNGAACFELTHRHPRGNVSRNADRASTLLPPRVCQWRSTPT